jgi:hypothetical protein
MRKRTFGFHKMGGGVGGEEQIRTTPEMYLEMRQVFMYSCSYNYAIQMNVEKGQ